MSKILINDHMCDDRPISELRYPLPGYINGENNTRMVLNPDINKLSSIMEEINKNNGWCPSKPSSAREDTLRPDTRCPCPDFMLYGKCECGLFVEAPLVTDKEPTKQYGDFINWNEDKKEEN